MKIKKHKGMIAGAVFLTACGGGVTAYLWSQDFDYRGITAISLSAIDESRFVRVQADSAGILATTLSVDGEQLNEAFYPSTTDWNGLYSLSSQHHLIYKTGLLPSLAVLDLNAGTLNTSYNLTPAVEHEFLLRSSIMTEGGEIVSVGRGRFDANGVTERGGQLIVLSSDGELALNRKDGDFHDYTNITRLGNTGYAIQGSHDNGSSTWPDAALRFDSSHALMSQVVLNPVQQIRGMSTAGVFVSELVGNPLVAVIRLIDWDGQEVYSLTSTNDHFRYARLKPLNDGGLIVLGSDFIERYNASGELHFRHEIAGANVYIEQIEVAPSGAIVASWVDQSSTFGSIVMTGTDSNGNPVSQIVGTAKTRENLRHALISNEGVRLRTLRQEPHQSMTIIGCWEMWGCGTPVEEEGIEGPCSPGNTLLMPDNRIISNLAVCNREGRISRYATRAF